MNPVWRIRLAEQAELDLFGITVWTLENFGDQQAQKYAETVSLAIEALEVGPEIVGLSLARIWVRVFVYCM
jgi:plasmid stabilization system protein ParE